MSRRSKKRSRRKYVRMSCAALCIALVFVLGAIAAVSFERRLSLPVENAGQQLTAYEAGKNTAQYFVDGQWITRKDVETLLVIGIDNLGSIPGSDSYNNSNQADFMVLLVHDRATGESNAVHLNRDTMTEIPILGVTGQQAGSMKAQLALAYTYGHGRQDSCKNTVNAVENLLYGIEIDRYITVTMGAVPIINDWAGGVTLEILDDFTGVDDTLVLGETTTLRGQHALNYVRERAGLEDSTNLRRMERQRQYASAWAEQAEPLFEDEDALMKLLIDMNNYYYTDCSAAELAEMADLFSANPPEEIYQLEGRNVRGDMYMEYYVDEDAVEKLAVELFYQPVSQ